MSHSGLRFTLQILAVVPAAAEVPPVFVLAVVEIVAIRIKPAPGSFC